MLVYITKHESVTVRVQAGGICEQVREFAVVQI